jgi:hypothetical protein
VAVLVFYVFHRVAKQMSLWSQQRSTLILKEILRSLNLLREIIRVKRKSLAKELIVLLKERIWARALQQLFLLSMKKKLNSIISFKLTLLLLSRMALHALKLKIPVATFLQSLALLLALLK